MSERRTPLDARVPPPIVAMVVAFAMWEIAWRVPGATVAVPARDTAAMALAVLGLVVEGAGAWRFVRARTSVDPTHPTSVTTLVTGGIYRFTRNPMYLGDLIILLGWGVHLANPLALALSALFVLTMDLVQIPPEERAMEALFGEAYSEYRARVRRWI